jgi:hypothetical protein
VSLRIEEAIFGVYRGERSGQTQFAALGMASREFNVRFIRICAMLV